MTTLQLPVFTYGDRYFPEVFFLCSIIPIGVDFSLLFVDSFSCGELRCHAHLHFRLFTGRLLWRVTIC